MWEIPFKFSIDFRKFLGHFRSIFDHKKFKIFTCLSRPQKKITPVYWASDEAYELIPRQSLLSWPGVCSCSHQIRQNSLKSGRIWGEANRFGDDALDLPPINTFITVWNTQQLPTALMTVSVNRQRSRTQQKLCGLLFLYHPPLLNILDDWYHYQTREQGTFARCLCIGRRCK